MFGFFFLIDAMFFAANTLKVPEGGWVPLVLGVALMALMTSWKRGRDLLLARWKQDSLPLASFLARLPQSRTIRVPGHGGVPDRQPGLRARPSLLHNLKHNKVLHERVLFVTVQNAGRAGGRAASDAQRGRGAGARHPPGDPALRLHGKPEHSPGAEDLRARGVPFDRMQASYFLGSHVRRPMTTVAPRVTSRKCAMALGQVPRQRACSIAGCGGVVRVKLERVRVCV